MSGSRAMLKPEELEQISKRFLAAAKSVAAVRPGRATRNHEWLPPVMASAADVGPLILDAERSRSAIAEALGYLSDTIDGFTEGEEQPNLESTIATLSTLVAILRYETGV